MPFYLDEYPGFPVDLVQFGALPPIYVPILMRNPLQPRPYPPQTGGSYMQNGSGPVPGARPLLPDNGRVIQSGPTRVLCIADVRGETLPRRAQQRTLTR
jgi:hypothetical protein